MNGKIRIKKVLLIISTFFKKQIEKQKHPKIASSGASSCCSSVWIHIKYEICNFGIKSRLHSRPGRCLLRWLNDGSNGVKSFVLGHNLDQLMQKTKDLTPLNHRSTNITNIAQVYCIVFKEKKTILQSKT